MPPGLQEAHVHDARAEEVREEAQLMPWVSRLGKGWDGEAGDAGDV